MRTVLHGEPIRFFSFHDGPGLAPVSLMKILLPLALAALAGCGTVADTAFTARSRDPGPHVFGGVRYDWDWVSTGGPCCRTAALAPCFFFDLPLSAAADLVLLPVTIPIALFRPAPKSAKEATSP